MRGQTRTRCVYATRSTRAGSIKREQAQCEQRLAEAKMRLENSGAAETGYVPSTNCVQLARLS